MAPRYQARYAPDFEQVPVYVMFLGYPRSGHTLIGALLNAHPETWIAHELNALKYVHKGLSRDAIFAKLIAQGKWFSARKEVWTGYSYKVPGQWQGRYRQLKAIGDKRGGASTRWITRHPDLLDRLHEVIDKDIRIIHNQRNPFDNITTRARGGNIYQREVDEATLNEEIAKHFRDVATINRLQKSGNYQILHMSHEAFVANPRQALIDMCEFIGVTPYPDYLTAALSIVRSSTNKSRHKIHWPEAAKQRVMEGIAQYDFLQGYTFDN